MNPGQDAGCSCPGRPHAVPRRQRGVTLFVALIFLMVLALLGIVAAQNSGLEERMAGNTRNRDLAFQAAESALKHVEANLTSGENISTLAFGAPPNAGLVDGSNCVITTSVACYLSRSNAYWETTYPWSPANARQPVANLGQVASQPLYVVEKLPSAVCSATATGCFRATARGVGGEGNAVAIVQAIYKVGP